MSLRGNIVKTVKWWFGWWDEEETVQNEPQTLNQQINSWEINNPTPPTTPTQTRQQPTLETQINIWAFNKTPDSDKITSVETPDTFTEGFLNPTENLLWEDSKEVLKREEEKKKEDENKSFWEKAWDMATWVLDFMNKIWEAWDAKEEYEYNKDKLAISYNKDNWNVMFLDLWLKWENDDVVESKYLQLLEEFNVAINQPGITQDDIIRAWDEFYKAASWLFRVKSDDYYSSSSSIFSRRKDEFSEDDLKSLAKNQWIESWNYVPTQEQFWNFYEMYLDNSGKKADIYNKHNLNNDDDSVDLSETARSRWLENFKGEWMQWIDSLLKQEIQDWRIRRDAELHISEIMNSMANRLYNTVSYTYALEQLVLAKDPSERTEEEKEMLKLCNMSRAAERKIASNFNNWTRQEIKYWRDDKGEIAFSLDSFEWWKDLEDVLMDWVKEATWLDLTVWDSVIDYMTVLNHKAQYLYNKSNWNWLEKFVWRVQNATEPAGRWLWEAWQELTKLTMYAWNILMLWFWQDESKESLSPTAKYMDQDFSIGRMLETDDWNIMRTLKDYWITWAEYVPEVVWNLIPDILLTVATWWAGWIWLAAKWVRWISLANKSLKTMKWANLFRKFTRTLWSIWATKYEWVEWVLNAFNKTKWISQTWKTWLELADRLITWWAIDQIIWWQLAYYDTEAYSPASLYLSAFWTLWWELIPTLVHADVHKAIRNTVRWWRWKEKALDNIWSIADFMDSGDDNAKLMARVLKNRADANISLDDIENFTRNFWEISWAAKQAFEQLPWWQKVIISKWTKELMYNIIAQTMWENSAVWKQARQILMNNLTNPADMLKYIGRLPWKVQFWPYVSTIKLKNWAQKIVTESWKRYDAALDTLQWGFASKLENWFTLEDIERISELKNRADVKDNIWTLFRKSWDKYYITEKWVSKFWLSLEDMPLETLWVSLAEAKNVKEWFKKLKWIINEGKHITDNTIDRIAETWWYTEVVEKIKEIVC